MSQTPSSLQIATRIHVLLLHEIGQGIDIENMVSRPRYARDVLLVCDACRGSELVELAQLFRSATPASALPPTRPTPPVPTALVPPPRRVPQSITLSDHRASSWGPTTTAFGHSRPSDLIGSQAVAGRAQAWISRWWQPS